MKFVLFVEGYTERVAVAKFIKRWLDPQLPRPVGIQTIRYGGWAEMVKDMPQKARMVLLGPDRDEIIAVIALLDLYGPTIYPTHLTSADQRIAWGTTELSRIVGQPRFKVHFAVHELEAWLLSNPALFPRLVGQHLPASASQPETVNFDTPPAKLLDRLYLQHVNRHYSKVSDGSLLFEKLDPAIAYQRCPHLAGMLDEMLELCR